MPTEVRQLGRELYDGVRFFLLAVFVLTVFFLAALIEEGKDYVRGFRR